MENRTKEFWTVTEVVELFEVETRFLEVLEEEEVIHPVHRDDPPAKLFSTRDLDDLRLAKILVEDMGVNLPGVEVILRMRQNMIDMRNQFDDILEDLARHVRETIKRDSHKDR
jgi:MerR family transcriptional regulator, heat shock protein HspR